jgi:hypothetical protein
MIINRKRVPISSNEWSLRLVVAMISQAPFGMDDANEADDIDRR